MRRIGRGFFIGIVCLLMTLPVRAQEGGLERPGFMAFECPDWPLEDYRFECGLVSVPADHAEPEGAQFQIAVVITHRAGVTPAPDPLVYLNGGPGGKTLANLPYFVGVMAPYLQDRDVIFFDMRGIGFSQPALDCPELVGVFGTQEGSAEAGREAVLGAVEACYQQVVEAGIDPDLFNSAQIAGDLAVMRTALGYEEWNLYGISYGTRTALTVLRDHPGGVRSVILDAVVPPEANLFVDGPRSSERAFDVLVAACEADWLCRAAYPDVKGTLLRVTDRLREQPVALELELADGTHRRATLDGAGFANQVIGLLASPASIPSIPAIIYAAGRGDFSALEPMLERVAEAQTGNIESPSSWGQAYSTLCAEEAPFNAAADIAAAQEAHPMLGAMGGGVSLSDYCTVWLVSPLREIETQPVTSDVPTLLGAGSYDSLASPDYAENAARHLRHAYVIEAPGLSHGIFGVKGCGTSIGRAFLGDPMHAPDASCFIDNVARPEWILSAEMARPAARALGWVLLPGGLAAIGWTAITMGRMARRGEIPWTVTLRRIGWWPVPASAALAAGLYVFGHTMAWEPSVLSTIALAAPLIMGIQAALALSPGDEPALEVVLAAPQPYPRLKLGQLVTLFGYQAAPTALAAAGIALATGERSAEAALLEWIGPALFLIGLAALVTARTHQATLGVITVIMAGFGFAVAGDHLLPPDAFGEAWDLPMGAIQPFAWIIHPYLTPDSLTPSDYLINRVVVSGLGLAMTGAALALLSKTERVLMAAKEGK